jgi:hypothetical protein
MLLTGCASQQPTSVPRSGSQREQPPVLSDSPKSQVKDRDRDLYECQREATFAGIGAKQQVFDNCMKARGYTPSNKAWYQR